MSPFTRLFFFSSRRRHTRCSRDWSSDVCSSDLFGEDHLALQRVLAGYATHPNVAAYILIGLGCEVHQPADMVDRQKTSVPGHPERQPFLANIQEAGGIRRTVERASARAAKLPPTTNDVRSTEQPT